jgi:hypothetical protein
MPKAIAPRPTPDYPPCGYCSPGGCGLPPKRTGPARSVPIAGPTRRHMMTSWATRGSAARRRLSPCPRTDNCSRTPAVATGGCG